MTVMFTSPNDVEMLDVGGVAKLLGCSSRHVRRLADAGRMPAPIRLGALIRWDRGALSRWISDGCQPVRRIGKGAR